MKQLRGFGVIEILIVSAVLSASIASLYSAFAIAHKASVFASDRTRANFLVEEGIEVMRFLRDKSWNANLASLNTNTGYYISFDQLLSRWSVSVSPTSLIDNKFKRIITLDAVMRNANDDIVFSGGTVDTNSYKVISIVTWGNNGTTSAETYLSDIFDN